MAAETSSRAGRLALIGVLVALVALAFVFTGGWLSPARLTQQRMIQALATSGGSVTGFRRNHSKGLCAAGWFEGNGQATALSRAALFASGSRTPVTARFSLAGGMPFQADKPGAVRALALDFVGPGGEWRTAMINLPVFPAATPQAFYELLLATAPEPATGKPDPARLHAFLAANPESAAALGVIGHHPPSRGFPDATFNGLDAFRFLDAAGHATPVRWSFVPVDPPAAGQGAADSGRNYLFDGLLQAMGHRALRWRLVLTAGAPGDPVDDPTKPWPGDRRAVDAGMLTLGSPSSDGDGPCRAINYDPTVLPDGITTSGDPIVGARSAVYARSFRLRAQESGERKPSAVSPQEVVQNTGQGR